MRILIFGGAGYVGQELVKMFSKATHEVAVFDNFSNGDTLAVRRLNKLKNVTIFQNTIANGSAVEEVITEFNPDVIYNLAALHYIPYCFEHPDEVFETNYSGLQNIISCLAKKPHVKFIFASSASVYGSHPNICNLATECLPNDLYGASKLSGEYLIKYQLENYVIMRLFNVYGNQDPHPHLIPKVIKAAVSNQNLNLGTAIAKRDFIHVNDVANALFVAINAPSKETYIVASGKSYSVKEIVEKIYKIANSSGIVTYDTIENIRSKDAPELMGDASKLESLGWSSSIELDEGLAAAIEEFRKIEAILI